MKVKNKDASFFTSWHKLEAGEDLPLGCLVGVKDDGKLYKATNKTGTPIKAVGIIYQGSTKLWGAKYELKREDILRKGDFSEVYRFAVITDATIDGTPKFGDPLYLGVDGAITATVPTGVGTLVQQIGWYEGEQSGFKIVKVCLAYPTKTLES